MSCILVLCFMAEIVLTTEGNETLLTGIRDMMDIDEINKQKFKITKNCRKYWLWYSGDPALYDVCMKKSNDKLVSFLKTMVSHGFISKYEIQ